MRLDLLGSTMAPTDEGDGLKQLVVSTVSAVALMSLLLFSGHEEIAWMAPHVTHVLHAD